MKFTLPFTTLAFSCFAFLACSNKPIDSEEKAEKLEKEIDPAQEALIGINLLYESMVDFFKQEHINNEITFIGPGGTIEYLAPHQCPNWGSDFSNGDSSTIPPLTTICSLGPDGKCVPTEDPKELYEYDVTLWDKDGIFSSLNFAQKSPHRFHYSVRAKNYTAGYGACQFTVQAFGDLDSDAIFSTYEMSGAGDIQGVNAAIGIYVNKEGE